MLVWGILVTGAAAAALISIRTTIDSGSDSVDPQARAELLDRLAQRLIPAAGGGWVVAEVGTQPAPDRWLMAAAALPGDQRSDGFDAALSAATSAIDSDDPDLARSSALSVATALGSPGDLPAGSSATGSGLLDRTLDELDGAGPSWLGVLLQLSAVPGETGRAATAELRSRVGDAGCDRLPSAHEPMPAPSSELTVLVRTLAAEHRRCPGAAEVLDRALASPAWRVPIAVPELADLAAVADRLSTDQRGQLGVRVDDVVEPDDGTVADLAILALLGRARAAIGISHDLPADVTFRLRNQVASEGRLADRSTSPVSPFDVAVLRQLQSAEAVPPGVLAATYEAAPPAEDGAGAASAERRVQDFLLEGKLPACSATHHAPATGKVTLVALIESQLLQTTRAHCADRLQVDELLDEAEALGSIEASPRQWITILAACHLDHSSISSQLARTVDRGSNVDDDPLWLAAAAALADPVATCDAERGA